MGTVYLTRPPMASGNVVAICPERARRCQAMRGVCKVLYFHEGESRIMSDKRRCAARFWDDVSGGHMRRPKNPRRGRPNGGRWTRGRLATTIVPLTLMLFGCQLVPPLGCGATLSGADQVLDAVGEADDGNGQPKGYGPNPVPPTLRPTWSAMDGPAMAQSMPLNFQQLERVDRERTVDWSRRRPGSQSERSPP